MRDTLGGRPTGVKPHLQEESCALRDDNARCTWFRSRGGIDRQGVGELYGLTF